MKSIVEFTTELYQEHLEEISGLFDMKHFVSKDEEQSWLVLEDIERRIEAHLDALVIGKEEAIELARERVNEGDAGELFGSVALFCRQSRFDLVQEAACGMDPSEEERSTALQAALCQEWPQHWAQPEMKALVQNPAMVAIVAKVIGFRRDQNSSDILREYSMYADPVCKGACLWALGRLRDNRSFLVFERHAKENDEVVSRPAMLSLLRIGIQHGIEEWLYASVKKRTWSSILVGLSGSKKHATELIDLASGRLACREHLLALGLLGYVGAFDVLLAQLEREELADSAAFALNMITGADLFEEKFIPEEIDEDELFEEEIEKLRRGESLYPPGQEPGKTIKVIAEKPDAWKQWLKTNRGRFASDIRYRKQQPITPAVLIEQMAAEENPAWLRQLGYEELVIRYDADFWFETEHTVAYQKKAIEEYQKWWKAHQNRFQAGQWYFNAKQC